MSHIRMQDRRLLLHLANLPRPHKPQKHRRANIHKPTEQDRCRVTATVDAYELQANRFRDYHMN